MNTESRTHGKDAILILHHAVDELCVAGEPPKYDFAQPILSWEVSPPKPYDEYPIIVTIGIVELHNSRKSSYLVAQDNLTYATIERDGQVLYDSRTEVPCDMDAF
jgi:hypothetical protein